MFRKLTLFILVILISFTAAGCSLPSGTQKQNSVSTFHQTPAIVNIAKDDIDKEKAYLETEKLRDELGVNYINLSLQIIPILIALLTLFLTNRSSAKSLVAQAEHNRKERMSSLLEKLGSQDTATRLAAIQALSEYRDSAGQLVNVLKIDSNSNTFSTVLPALLKMPEDALSSLVKEIRYLVENQFELASQLLYLGMTRENTASDFSIDRDELSDWTNNSRHLQIQKAMELKITLLQKVKGLSVAEINEIEKNRLITEWIALSEGYDRLIKAAARVIEKVSSTESAFDLGDACLRGIILDRLDLSGWNFDGADLRGARFANATCKGTSFINADVSGANFNHSNLEKAKFDHADVNRTNFIATHLHGATFTHCKGESTKFQGAKLHHTDLSNVEIKKGQFDNAELVGTKFENAVLYGARFEKSRFSGANFSGADLSGAQLITVSSADTDYTGTVFAGTLLNGSRFCKDQFVNTVFKEVKNFEGAEFVDVVRKEVAHRNDTAGFRGRFEG